ncbi:hypothetical protein ACOHYD_12145 [Desulfobacterota bacterium M19]
MTAEEKISVHVYPDSSGSHIMQIYAGLYELDAAGKIKLHFLKNPDKRLGKPTAHSLFLVISNQRSDWRCLVCFDMHDCMEIDSAEKLQACDIYFKRSYSQPYIETLPDTLAGKIYPFGFNYACCSHYERRHVVSQLISHHCVTGKFQTGKAASIKTILKKSLRLLLQGQSRFPLYHEFEENPDNAGNGKILFQSRVWDPEDSPRNYQRDPEKHRRLNENRANTVRALRSAFGDVFMGGLEPTDFAARHFSDCLTNLKTNKEKYLELVKQCSVAVTTTGLHDSTGWKLPEFVAASRCVVTEPIKYAIPGSFVEHLNYFTFTTPEECVKACGQLIADKQLARSMRESNFSYYHQALSPSALILDRLQFVLTKLVGQRKQSSSAEHVKAKLLVKRS